jgi:SAM-dependent methyltransferase
VLATDIDTRFLNGLEESTLGNIEVRQHDIMSDPLPERAFDIIHARHVFVHLPRSKEYLARLMRAAKPGGWLFIEDFDPVVDRAIPILDQVEAQAFRSAIKCPYIAFERRGSEPDWGRKLANTFQHLGLTDIEVQAHLELVKGGSLFAEFYKLSLARIRHESVVAGWAKDSDFATTLALLDRPEFMCFSSVMFSAMPNGSTLTEWELSKCPLLRRFQGISGSGGDVVRSMFMTQFGSSVR